MILRCLGKACSFLSWLHSSNCAAFEEDLTLQPTVGCALVQNFDPIFFPLWDAATQSLAERSDAMLHASYVTSPYKLPQVHSDTLMKILLASTDLYHVRHLSKLPQLRNFAETLPPSRPLTEDTFAELLKELEFRGKFLQVSVFNAISMQNPHVFNHSNFPIHLMMHIFASEGVISSRLSCVFDRFFYHSIISPRPSPFHAKIVHFIINLQTSHFWLSFDNYGIGSLATMQACRTTMGISRSQHPSFSIFLATLASSYPLLDSSCAPILNYLGNVRTSYGQVLKRSFVHYALLALAYMTIFFVHYCTDISAALFYGIVKEQVQVIACVTVITLLAKFFCQIPLVDVLAKSGYPTGLAKWFIHTFITLNCASRLFPIIRRLPESSFIMKELCSEGIYGFLGIIGYYGFGILLASSPFSQLFAIFVNIYFLVFADYPRNETLQAYTVGILVAAFLSLSLDFAKNLSQYYYIS